MKPNPISILSNKNFRNLFVAGIASRSGRAVANISLVWLVFQETGSSLDLAYLGVAETIAAIIFSLVAGLAVDRFNRRRLMILADLIRGFALIFLVGDLLLIGFNLVIILLVAFVVSSFSVFFSPSEYAVIPEVVGGANVSDANGLVRSSRSISDFAGSALAGVLIVSIGAVLGLAYNSITFFASAALIAAITANVGKVSHKSSEAATAKISYLKDLRGGFGWLKGNKGWLELTISALFLNFFFTIAVTYMVVFSTRALNQGGLIFGSILALSSIGDAIGALMVGRVNATRFAGKAWTLPYGIGCGAFLLVMSLFVNVYVTLLSALAMGVLIGFAGTSWLSAAQIIVPSSMQGRYFGIDSLGSNAIIPTAQISGALLIGSLGVTETFGIAALGLLATGVGFILFSDLRHLRAIPSSERALTDVS